MDRALIALFLVGIFTLPAVAPAATYQVDPDHSNFQFKVRHLTVSNVKGEFTKAGGVVSLDDQDLTRMKINITIDAASVDTGHTRRDEHLRTEDFFYATRYPTITFVSKRIEKATAPTSPSPRTRPGPTARRTAGS